MKSLSKVISSVCMLIMLAGCISSGLSPRETGTQSYSHYVLSLYDNGPASPSPAAAEQSFPINLAVAQMGEIAPPSGMLEELSRRPELFNRAEAIPGHITVGHHNKNAQQDPVKEQMQNMQRLARDMGMDHLLVFGGTVDYGTRASAFSVLDLTIVGLFVVPSRQIKADGRASAALVDLKTQRVLFIVTAEAQAQRLASAATQKGDQQRVLESMRDQLTDKLTREFVKKCEQRRNDGKI